MTKPKDEAPSPSDDPTLTRNLQKKASASSPSEGDTATLQRPAVPETERRFSSGDVVGNRFRIVSFLARGGMGEVYEAEDLELKGRVALKTIRPAVAHEGDSLERFRREIHLARKVTHPNVCRIFDLYRHASPDGSELSFLAMELLSGETLSRRLKRLGRMTPEAALPLVEQMAAALQAAHRASIVHRDFKPDNVMLLEEEGGCRAVVTDFGLSRSHKLDTEAESVTGTGVLVGTPAYMSPEQVEGKEVTPASDIYALGLVLYEMVTGLRPFAGTSPLVTAAARVNQLPTPPRRHAPELSDSWEATILKCLERDPERRFKTAISVAESLRPQGKKKRERRPWLAAAALLFGAVLGLTLLPRSPETPPTLPDVASIQPRRAVAVLGFQNLSGNPDVAWLSTALAEMLGTELSQGDALRVVPGDRVAQMKNDLSLEEDGRYNVEVLKAIQTNLGVDFIVFGSYVALGEIGPLRVDLRLQDASSGEIVGSVRDAAALEELFELANRVGSSLRDLAGFEPASPAPRQNNLPAHREAAKLYVEGLEMHRSFEHLEAQSRLERALEIEPNHPLIQSALAQVFWDLQYAGRARDLAKQAYEHSRDLDLEQRLQIEARYRRYIGSTEEREKAAQIYSTLWSSFPDGLDYGLLLVSAQPSLKALATIEELKKLSPPAGTDPRIFLLEAEVRSEVSTLDETLEACRRAASEARSRNARLTLAQARLCEGTTLARMGSDAEALQTLEGAKTLFAASADTIGMIRALEEIAKVNRHVGPTEARKYVSEAVALAREVGALPQAGNALLWFAQVAANEGDYRAAEKMIDEAEIIWEDVGDDIDIARTLAIRSFVHYLKGDLRSAEELERRSQERVLLAGDEETIRYSYFDLARIQRERGDLISAEENFRQVLELERKLGLEAMTASDLLGLVHVQGEQGRFDEAVPLILEAIRISERTADFRYQTELYLELADLQQARSDEGEARRTLETTRAMLSNQGAALWASLVTVKLALLHRASGDSKTFERLLGEAIAEARPLLRTADAMDEPLERLGRELVAAGAFDVAEEVYRERLAFYRRRGNRYETLWMLRRMGLLHRARGELEQARRLYREALEAEKDLSGFRDVDGLYVLAAVEEDLGDLDAARGIYLEAIANSTERGLDRKAAYAELDLASLDIELGRLQGLEEKIRGVAGGLARQRSVYGRCYAGLVLARLNRAQGRVDDAETLIRESLSLSKQVLPGPFVDWHKGPHLDALASLEAARILSAGGAVVEAKDHLENAKRRAVQLSHLPLQLETRLVEGEVELRSGSSDAGRRILGTLVEEAESKGFGLIRRKAEALLSR